MALINQAPESDLLKANSEAILAKVNPRMRREVERIVLAGIKTGNTHAQEFVQALRRAPDPLKACAEVGVNFAFMGIKAGNQHPSDDAQAAATYASYLLMLQAMDVAEKLKLIEVTDGAGGTIDKATRMATDRIFAAIRMTPEKMQQAASQVAKVTKDPKHMEAIKLYIGASRDPRAPQPVIPDEEGADAQ